MATNKGSAIGRYLGSRKNILGALAGIVGVGAGLFAHIPLELFPVVAGGLYGAAALLVPAERTTFAINTSTSAAQVGELRKDLDSLEKKTASVSRKLPPHANRLVEEILGDSETILERADALHTSADHLFALTKILRDYLPSSLDAYLKLPPEFTHKRIDNTRRTPTSELIAQLQVLRNEIKDILEAAVRGDMTALMDQGRFLQERFRKSSLNPDS